MTPNISYRPTRLPDAVPPNRNSCAGQPPETASGNYLQPSRFQHATPPPCLRRPYNKYRISLPTFQKIPEFYRFIKSIFYGTRLLPLPRQRTVRPKGRPLSNAAGRNAPPFRETEPADGISSAGIRQSQPERNRQSRSFRCIRFIRLPSRDRPRSMKYIR